MRCTCARISIQRMLEGILSFATPPTLEATMKNLRALLATCILGAGLGACDSPALVAPEAPRFDGGPFTVGSGNRTGDSISSTTADTGAERGGPFTVGSGN